MNGSGIPPVTTVSVFQSTYSLLPVISIRAVLTHEMLVHQIIINALKLWVNAARNPRHSGYLFHHHRVMHGVMRIFTPENGPCWYTTIPGVCSGSVSPSVSIMTLPVLSSYSPSTSVCVNARVQEYHRRSSPRALYPKQGSPARPVPVRWRAWNGYVQSPKDG